METLAFIGTDGIYAIRIVLGLADGTIVTFVNIYEFTKTAIKMT